MKQAIEGVYVRKTWDDATLFGVVCDCGDDTHNHNVWIEADDVGVHVTVYTQVKTRWWEQSRWRAIWCLLTRGYVEYEATISMSEQQALNYAGTLTQAVKSIKKSQVAV